MGYCRLPANNGFLTNNISRSRCSTGVRHDQLTTGKSRTRWIIDTWHVWITVCNICPNLDGLRWANGLKHTHFKLGNLALGMLSSGWIIDLGPVRVYDSISEYLSMKLLKCSIPSTDIDLLVSVNHLPIQHYNPQSKTWIPFVDPTGLRGMLGQRLTAPGSRWVIMDDCPGQYRLMGKSARALPTGLIQILHNHNLTYALD